MSIIAQDSCAYCGRSCDIDKMRQDWTQTEDGKNILVLECYPCWEQRIGITLQLIDRVRHAWPEMADSLVANGPHAVNILLADENVNGDPLVVVLEQLPNRRFEATFFDDFYDPEEYSEVFECPNLPMALRLLHTELVTTKESS